MQDLKAIENMYDSVAKNYAKTFLNEHHKKPKDQEVLYRFSQMIIPNSEIWDLGCGCGETTKYLNELGVKVSGLDLSAKMIEQAKIAYPDISFHKGNILALEFNNNSIDAIVSFYAIVHFTQDQVQQAFQEIYRVLKKNGILLFTYHVGDNTIHLNQFLQQEIDIDFMFHNTEAIINLLQEIGFKEIEVIEREPYKNIEYQSKRAYIFAKKT